MQLKTCTASPHSMSKKGQEALSVASHAMPGMPARKLRPHLGKLLCILLYSSHMRYEDTFLCCIPCQRGQTGHDVCVLGRLSTLLPQLMKHAWMHPLLQHAWMHPLLQKSIL